MEAQKDIIDQVVIEESNREREEQYRNQLSINAAQTCK
jgi:hypothetical protein